MATSQLPSFDSLRDSDQNIRSSMDMLRLRWKPFGPLNTSIYVMDDVLDSSSAQQPYQTESGSFHPVSFLAATEPPVSSITVMQRDLKYWESDWVEEHYPHAVDDDVTEGIVWVQVVDDVKNLEEEEGGEADCGFDDDIGRKLMRCCDEARPKGPPPFVVRASTQPFVTIHDFVTAAHPWLQTVRDDILAAMGVHLCGPLAPDTPLYVYPLGLRTLTMVEGRNGQPDFEATWKAVALHALRRVNGTLSG